MDDNTNQFGDYIRAARERKALSLRAVEKATGVSNAYLSQLENGVAKQPSPLILHKLAHLYEIPYSDLFQLVGYPLPGKTDVPLVSGLAARLGSITSEEEDELVDYLDFLRSKRRKGNKD